MKHSPTDDMSRINSGSPKKKHGRKPVISCFNIFLVLAAFQAVILLLLGFFSDHFTVGSWSSGHLEHFAVPGGHPQNSNDDVWEIEQLLVDNTEKRLEAAIIDDGESDHHPLDDYYSRQHISNNPVPVIIGGTDGSGTRAFADVLANLGVPMIIDDPETLDVHATKMFAGEGWPPLARMVLQETHSSNYKIEDLSNATVRRALFELERMTHGYSNRFRRLLSKAETQEVTVASKVTYGYKAPVTMLILPLLQQINKDGLKFIHVVRDGRDVSLSKNQSPIKKFYKDSYPDGENRLKQYQGTEMAPVLGMHLWNDWNTGVLEWERSHADGNKFDFLVMRTEDLLDPEKKFESLLQLADFVGSPKTMKELCCLSQQAATDMGSSGVMSSRNAGRERLFGRFQHFNKRFGGGGHGSDWFKRKSLPEEEPTSGEDGGGFSGLVGFGSRGSTERVDYANYLRNRHREVNVARYREVGRRVGERVRQRREEALRARQGRRRLDTIQGLGHAEHLLHPHGGTRFAGGKTRDSLGMLGMRDTILRPAPKQDETKPKDKNKAPSVNQRYGKWAKMLEDKPEVVAKLHEDGKKGLEAFGYEPRTRFMDRAPKQTDFQCDDRVVCNEDTK